MSSFAVALLAVAAATFAVVQSGAVLGTAVPLAVKTCADDRPDVTTCRKSALQQAIPLLAHGIPSIGAAPIDPLDNLPPLAFKVEQPGINIYFHMGNITVSGIGRSVLDDLDVNTATGTIRLLSHVPGEVVVEGDHATDAYIFGVPHQGSGRYTLVATNPAVEAAFSGHPAPGADGNTYLQLTSVQLRIDLGDTKYLLTGVYGDYPPLVSALSKFITEESSPIVEKLIGPTVEAWLSDICRSRAQQVFSTVPYDVLFPKTSAISGFYRAFFPYA